MIGEIGTGSSFRGLNHYLLHGSAETGPREPTWAELRNLAVPDPDRAYRVMHVTAQQNQRVDEPVLHVIVSPAPEDRLSREQWSALADRVLSGLGLDEHQALVVHHSDTDVQHLHLSVNRIHPERLTAWPTWRSKTRLEAILRRIERDWGLRRVEGRLGTGERETRDHAPVPRKLRAQARHRATQPQLLAWRESLTPHLEAASSWSDLAVRLQANGIRLEARGRGLVVTDGDIFVKASSIGRSYSRGRLEERFGQTLADWRATRKRFDAAAGVYGRYAHRPPSHPRTRAARRALQAAGRSLGWRAAARLSGPLAPAVGAVVSAARARARDAARTRAAGERAWRSLLERRLAPALRRAGSWAEVEGRLRFHGVWLGTEATGRRPGSAPLVLTDGVHKTPLSTLPADLSARHLAARFGSWSAWQAARRELLSRARRLHRYDATLEARTERFHRLLGLAQNIELRVERHRGLRAELQAAEARLRQELHGYLPRKTTPADVTRLLRELRTAPESDLERRITARRSRLVPRLGTSRGHHPHLPEDLRRSLRTYRQLVQHVVRDTPVARSAARRLPQIRRRAQLLDPRESQRPLQEALLRTAARVGGIGLRSLLSQAAPGLGAALRLVRLVRRVGRRRERGGRER